ncbi:hypothetical protein ACFONC_11680 [Luteimonas soli]|uniref:Peptidase n=1 Tax=Luteimonas soli TaxID=1648966 RepID=A0ABV7XLS8_9GAMM
MTKPASATASSQATGDIAGDGAQVIEIFRAGRQTDMHGRTIEFSRQDLADIAAGYDPALHEAPVVIGHPKDNTPAFGWVRGLQVDGDVLSAQLHQVDADFADMVRAGRFKKRSASIFLPDGSDNPTPGKYALRHVGFLGGAVPAVKGLKEVNFAGDTTGFVEFAEPIRWWVFGYIADLFRGLREREIESNGLEKANLAFPTYLIDSIREASREPSPTSHYAAPAGAEEITTIEVPDMPQDKNTPADFAAREQKIADDTTALEQREKALADRETKARRDDAAEFADGLVKDGKLLPKDKAPVVELLLALPTAAPLSFASGDDTIEKPAAELFRELLAGLPQRMDFNEKSHAEDSEAGAASFAAPQGTVVSADGLELHRKALAYQATHAGVSFVDAYKAVGGA